MEKQIFSDFIDKYRDAEMVVIGIGEEWNAYLEKQEYQDNTDRIEVEHFFMGKSESEKSSSAAAP